jgi:hypothetical protein
MVEVTTDPIELTKIAIEAIKLFQTQYEQVDMIWGYFSVISIGVAGFILGSEKVSKSFHDTLIIIAAYSVFCIGNFLALYKGHVQLKQFASFAIARADNAKIDVSTIDPYSPFYISIFYVGIYLTFVTGLLYYAYAKSRKSEKG